jgi:hypothetical protein
MELLTEIGANLLGYLSQWREIPQILLTLEQGEQRGRRLPLFLKTKQSIK